MTATAYKELLIILAVLLGAIFFRKLELGLGAIGVGCWWVFRWFVLEKIKEQKETEDCSQKND